MHPNAKGVARMVEGMLPVMEKELAARQAADGSLENQAAGKTSDGAADKALAPAAKR